jgi:hypothetical protein
VGDLQAELAGGHHDQGLRGAVAGGGDPLQDRHAETERLAGAGAGLADDVLAGQGQRQGELLDGERALDARGPQRADDLRPGAELFERGGVRPDRGAGLQRVGGVDLGDAGFAVFQRDRVDVGFGVVDFLDCQVDRLSRVQRALPGTGRSTAPYRLSSGVAREGREACTHPLRRGP